MGRKNQSDPTRKSFILNGIRYYYRNDKLCAMPAKWEKVERPATEKQQVARDAMEITGTFPVNFFRLSPVLYFAWNMYGEYFSLTYLDIFRKLNYPVLDLKLQGVDYFPDFHFCKGDLVPPRDTRVTREGWTFFLYWNSPAREYGRANPNDSLALGFFYDSCPDSPQFIMTSFTRGECFARIALPDSAHPETETVHLYPFFTSPDWSAYSDSRYVKAEVIDPMLP